MPPGGPERATAARRLLHRLGAVSYLITAAGMGLSAGNAAGLAYGQALLGCLVGLWCYLLCQPRFGRLSTSLLCPMVVLMAIVPTVIGGSSTAITPGAIYNRFGYALTALLMIESMRRPERGIARIFGGISSGLILGILLFLKISFFVGAVGLLLALAPLKKQVLDRWRGIALAFAGTVLGFSWYLRFDLVAMYSDLRTVAHAKHVMLGWHLAGDAVAYAFPFLLLIHWITKSRPSTPGKDGYLDCRCGGVFDRILPARDQLAILRTSPRRRHDHPPCRPRDARPSTIRAGAGSLFDRSLPGI